MNDFNRFHNCRNPFQTDAKRVLCVCSAGLLRSPTAANVLHREFGYNTRAAGCNDYALIRVDAILVHWADEIVLMEDSHLQTMESQFADGEYDWSEKIKKTLNVPDRFEWMKDELQKYILQAYNDCNNGSM